MTVHILKFIFKYMSMLFLSLTFTLKIRILKGNSMKFYSYLIIKDPFIDEP